MLITGATGNNGQELVRQLIALGQPIRALVRNPEEASGIKGPNVELAVGDFDRRNTGYGFAQYRQSFSSDACRGTLCPVAGRFYRSRTTYRREASGQILGFGSGPEHGFGVTSSTCSNRRCLTQFRPVIHNPPAEHVLSIYAFVCRYD